MVGAKLVLIVGVTDGTLVVAVIDGVAEDNFVGEVLLFWMDGV